MSKQRTKLFCFALAVCLLLSSAGAMAQESKPATVNDWSRLNSITTGTKLSVKLKNGQAVNGELHSVTDATLSLMVKGKSVDLKREEISGVYEIKKKSATKSTLIGLGVGAGAGAVIGVAGRGDNGFNKIDNAFTAGITVLGAAAGALTGYLLGRRAAKRTLIYQASQP
jgi:small nuclear ribonucleoprotein (snRNP)-like protein